MDWRCDPNLYEFFRTKHFWFGEEDVCMAWQNMISKSLNKQDKNDFLKSSTTAKLLRARTALSGSDTQTDERWPSMFDHDVISFAHGEGIRRPYPEAIKNMISALHDPDSFPVENYMFLQRHEELEDCISQEMQSIGIPIDLSKNIVIDAGTSRLITAALDYLTKPGDSVITFPGFYHPLASWCDYRSLKLVVVPQRNGDDLIPNAFALDRAIQNNTNVRKPVVVLFNPSISGVVCRGQTLLEIARVLTRSNIWAIEDALFANCLPAGKSKVQRLAQTEAAQQLLTVSGASKMHGLANMRIGWGCGPADLVRNLQDSITSSSATIPHLSKVAALGALKASTVYKKANLEEIQKRITLLSSEIKELDSKLRSAHGIQDPLITVHHQPIAGHSLLLDFNGFVKQVTSAETKLTESADLTKWILKRCKVAFAPAQSHGFNGFLLRANIASIGTSFTYSASLEIEKAWRGEWNNEHEKLFEKPFTRCRNEIRSAITDRITPVFLEALSSQKHSWRP